MEVIAIQKSALDEMKNELSELLEMTENATRKYTPIFKEEKWLDNQEVCLMMNITKRTLQQYRDDKILPYIQIGGKIIYKESDILTILEQNYTSNI
ncbi:helix-turn-helix domain-containing protein [Flavobacterium sp. JP2137]|uniref:helix-turn-helix domain-containing protein n=1 Tax=Flavobacterium sp. JP2137 TaxID=3414510 RepID=UPI003D2FAC6D